MRSASGHEEPEGREEGMCVKAFSAVGWLPNTVEWFFFSRLLLKTKGEKALFAATAFTVWTNKSYLFIWFPLKHFQLTNANNTHNAAPPIYCSHTPRENHWYMVFRKPQHIQEVSGMQQPTTGNNKNLIQSFTIMQKVLKSKFVPFGRDVIINIFIFLKGFLAWILD